MGHSPTGNIPGRPKLSIDWGEVDKYLQAGCSGAQVAAVIGVSADTLYRRCQTEQGASFSAILQEKRANGDAYLQLKQFSLAIQGDRGLLIWLGKQRLGQKDRPEEALTQIPSIQVVHYGNNSRPETWAEKEQSK
ncbi:MAG: hypothetical protein P0S96_07700 [Simkaniaceae bacterium]|nr:hypothetical protein [Candidatus Sacchlamyda saccharinae]